MKRFLSLIAVFALLITCTSCSGGGNKAISYSLSASPSTLDPQYATDTGAHIIIGNTFEGLMRLSENGEVVNALAESHTVSSDGLTYTFNLKHGTEWYCPSVLKREFGEEFYNKFSTEKVTARDFVFAMQRAVSPDTGSPSAHRLFVIKNAAEIHSGKADLSALGVTAPDDYTLVIRLNETCPNFLERLTESVFMPCNEDFFNSMNGRYGLTHKHILCNGPFYVGAWSKDDSLSIRRNKYYSGTREVLPSSVNFDFGFDLKTVSSRISSASLSAAMLPPDCALPENSTVIKENKNSVFGFVFNCKDKYIQNPNVRLALCNSVDRSLFSQEINSATPMSGFVPESCSMGSAGYRETVGGQTPQINKNDAAAQAYWRTALSELDKNVVEITVLCPEWLDNQVRRQLQIWQQTLGISLGISIETKTPEEIQEAVNSGNFQIALAGIEAEQDSAVDFLASLRSGGVMGFNSHEYGTVIDRLLTVEDESDLLAGCFTAETYILQQGYCYPLYCRSSRFVVNDEIEGITLGNSESTVCFIGTKRYN